MKKKPQKTKGISTDDLALMVQRGFADITSNMATGMEELKQELKKDIKEVSEKVDHVEYLVNGHDRRIDVLEDKVRIISVKIGLSK